MYTLTIMKIESIILWLELVVGTYHYQNPGLCRVSASLPSAFSRALGKEAFAERRTRQSPTLGNKLVYRVQDTRHRNTLGKDITTA